MIFAIFDVWVTVNVCINYSFYTYICYFITAEVGNLCIFIFYLCEITSKWDYFCFLSEICYHHVHSYIEVYKVSSFDGFGDMPNISRVTWTRQRHFQKTHTSLLWEETRRSCAPSWVSSNTGFGGIIEDKSNFPGVTWSMLRPLSEILYFRLVERAEVKLCTNW